MFEELHLGVKLFVYANPAYPIVDIQYLLMPEDQTEVETHVVA